MSRRLERGLIYCTGIWQIVDGLLTIFLYGLYIKKQGSKAAGLNIPEMHAMQSLFGSIFNFVVIFGFFLIIIGLVNLYLGKYLLKDGVILWRTPIWFLSCGIISYFMMDVVSLFLLMSSGVITLAKNKGFKRIQTTK
ncbi:hypothetical protein [Heyndrickxia ginsengihumi]|uniref:Uncharacterized protein n=2 Tax=Heyndrickxia ginsengihumi TaxID=363870 RepID=A0A6M0P3M2_9BACI|nr:hypothetical protein [Heyndrickxia ginsengihumi]MBE6183507.1 hypothetical protein [Bacillus sp. (in: firmicutes)]NEY19292.1 hypothetical protein [Heyndrickxia ginsengihumi]